MQGRICLGVFSEVRDRNGVKGFLNAHGWG